MYFRQLLLLIISKFQGERSSTAPYYLLKGKKSGQTMQDVTYFNLHAFFSLYPKLTLETYNSEIAILLENGYIEIMDQTIHITPAGIMHIKQMRMPQYNGWLYRGNEQIFWGRMELVIQTLSHFQNGNKKFIPNQKDQMVHQFVKTYLKNNHFQLEEFQKAFKKQLKQMLENSKFESIHRELFVYRLSGYHTSGLTWEQLAEQFHKSILEVKFLFIESLHIALTVISSRTYPTLYALTQDIEVTTPLTDSASRTYHLFAQGHSLDTIAKMRYLKINTIEDHVIEIVSANKGFPISSFITNVQIQKVLQVSKEMQTKKLTTIREQVPELSYFQIRIALAKGEEGNG